MTEDELIAKARDDFGDELESYERTAQPGLFLASLEAYCLNGMADEESGDQDSPTGHFYRVERWVVFTDSQGFHTIDAHETVPEAIRHFEKLNEEYGKWEDS